MAEIYPLTLGYNEGNGSEIRVVVTREGWRFEESGDELVFRALPIADRLSLLGKFAEQVALAQRTPHG